MFKKKENKSITERIKSFEDALKELGESDELVIEYHKIKNIVEDDLKLLSFIKLRIIVKALNEGWYPRFLENEYKFYPVFKLLSEMESIYIDEGPIHNKFKRFKGNSDFHGIICYSAKSSDESIINSISPDLFLISQNLALYCGEQFIDLWINYLINK
jgi:hypothetical protein